jgi:hypothetical protein
MATKADNKHTEVVNTPEVKFKCKFCGETNSLSELVVMRQYYPPVSVCKACARASQNQKSTKETKETKETE